MLENQSVDRINTGTFVFPEKHRNEIYATFDTMCKKDGKYWTLQKDGRVILSVREERKDVYYSKQEKQELKENCPKVVELLETLESPMKMDIYVYHDMDSVVCRPKELHDLLEALLSQNENRYIWDRRLWTWEEAVSGMMFNGYSCLDFYGAYYRGGPYMNFSIIKAFDDEGNCKSKTSSVQVTDNILNDWLKGGLDKLKVYYTRLGELKTGVFRWGENIIPPESLEEFFNIIRTNTSEHFSNASGEPIKKLLNMVYYAKQNNLYLYYGGV